MKIVRRCEICGADLFTPQTRCSGEIVTCGSSDCEREASNSAQQQRDEAHEQLGRDLGWF